MNTLLKQLDNYLSSENPEVSAQDTNSINPDISKDMILRMMSRPFNAYHNPSVSMTLRYEECFDILTNIPFNPENCEVVVRVTVICNGTPRFIMIFHYDKQYIWIQLYDSLFPTHTKLQNTHTKYAEELDLNITRCLRDIDGWVNYMPRFETWWNKYKDPERGTLKENTSLRFANHLGTYGLQSYLVDFSTSQTGKDWTLRLSFHPDGLLRVEITRSNGSSYNGTYKIPNDEKLAAAVIYSI